MMGLIGGLGKAGLGLGKGALHAGGDMAGAIGKASANIGGGFASRAMSKPGAMLAFAGGAGALGYALSDADGRANPMADAGMFASGAMLATAVPLGVGGAALGTGTALTAGVASAGIGTVGAMSSLGSKMIKVPDKAISLSNLNDLKFTGLGKTLIGAGAVIEGGRRAYGDFKQGRMGRHDGMVHTQTPTMPQPQQNASYANNGGATGDLVFSLYNNR